MSLIEAQSASEAHRPQRLRRSLLLADLRRWRHSKLSNTTAPIPACPAGKSAGVAAGATGFHVAAGPTGQTLVIMGSFPSGVPHFQDFHPFFEFVSWTRNPF